MTKDHYLNLFRVTEAQLQGLAAEGIAGGGSYCDLFFESTSYSDLLLRDGKVAAGGFHIDHGVGIRVLDGEKTGYAYSESTDARAMSQAVRAAAKIAAGNRGQAQPGSTGWKAGQALEAPDRYPMDEDGRLFEASRFVPYLEELERKLVEN